MDIIFSLTLRYFKQNKKRTCSILLGIITATILLVASSLYMTSYLKKLSRLEVSSDEIKPIFTAAFVIMAVLLSILVLFIYNILSLSAKQKTRYLGMLATVGATPFQRSRLIVLEACFYGLAGIPAGMLLGVILAITVFPFPVTVSWKMLLTVFLCEFSAILLSGVIPAYLSGRRSVMSLIQNKTGKQNFRHPVRIPKWILSRFGITAHFAVKNIVFYKTRYLILAVSVILSMILFLNGFIYMNYLDGNYEIRDTRTKEAADLTVNLDSSDKQTAWNTFLSEITSKPEVKEYAIREEADLGGVLFPEAQISPKFRTCSSYVWTSLYTNPVTISDSKNHSETGCYMSMVLVGLDDRTFDRYLEQAGCSDRIMENPDRLPVLIEDYPLISHKQNLRYQSILNIKGGESFTLTGKPYSIGMMPDAGNVESFTNWNMQVIGTTSEAPPCYDVTSSHLYEPNTIFFYTRQRNFEQFAEENKITTVQRSVSLRVKSSVPDLPETALQPVLTKFIDGSSRQLHLASSARKLLSEEEVQKNLLKRHEETRILQKEICRIGEKYELFTWDGDMEHVREYYDYHVSDYPGYILYSLSDPYPLVRHLFLYGVLIFITIISVFQIVKMILSTMQTRQQEFAVFLSLGMNRRQIGKMVCIEHLLCIIGSFLIGMGLSVAAAFAQFSSWKEQQAVEVTFPYVMIVPELIFLMFLILLSVFLSMRSVKNVKILEIIRTESI